MLIYHHRLPTCDYHPWLSHNYWWEDFEGQDAYWEENSISVQITDCWGDSGVREAGKEGTTKSCLHRWIGRVCRWRCTSRNYRDNCILCQGEMHSTSMPNLASCPHSSRATSLLSLIEIPISREVDGEIEMYLRGGFENILEQQGFPQLLSSWSTDNNIRSLVKAAAGLFAHPFLSYEPWRRTGSLISLLHA